MLRDSYAVSHAFALAIANECLRRSDDDDWGADEYDAEEGEPLVTTETPASASAPAEAIVDDAGRRYAFADHHCFACGGTTRSACA